MSEQIIRDALADKERQRDRVDDANRFGRIEREHSVLRTLFDALVKRFEEAVDRAVNDDDLEKLQRELEDEMTNQLSSICNQQSKDILNEVRTLFTEQKIQIANDQLQQQAALLQAQAETRKEIIRYGIGFALTVLAALAIFYLTGR